MNSLSTKFKTVVLLALLGGFTFQCEKKKDDQTDMAVLLGLVALTSSAGDCPVSAGRYNLNTWTNDITGTTSGTPAQLSRIGIGHVTTSMKLTADGSTSLQVTGSSYILVYKSNSCPLGASNLATRGGDYTISGGVDSNSEFPNSWKIANQTATITFTGSTGFYVFIYAIPDRSQSAAVTYTFSQ
ncbi:hypothetical protein EHQ82_05390 [Leptospira selangorensis]|uniref:Lipocalin-like domain-containing protein n=1 Tax=Leptospira selangorensis TaxID=2484982 RepID=A0ABY2NFV1_9LEPT|nr:hypothetical protein [Leptospira selangorensis]TGM23592.1 hypothetical protein EHQ82_05390 [Leptospira selangorensis]